MIENMNHEEFIVQVKECVCRSDWHWQYYSALANRYHWRNVWLKGSLGVLGVIGATMAGSGTFQVVGAVLAGGSAFILGSVLPAFNWDKVVSGLKDEEQEWASIFTNYERVRDIATLYSKNEILAQEFQKAKALQESSRLNDRYLPQDEKLRDEIELKVREYYGLDAVPIQDLGPEASPEPPASTTPNESL
jgi:hypothetical protein